MTIPSNELLVGYDYDAWYGYSEKIPVTVDASTKNNSQTLICGMSGSGKSYLTNQYFARICLHGGNDGVLEQARPEVYLKRMVMQMFIE